MKFGILIGSCVDLGSDQRHSIESIRKHTDPSTEVIIVFNGMQPFDVPSGCEIIALPDRIGREQGIWKLGYDLAIKRKWSWMCNFHDDLVLYEPGWEASIKFYSRTYRIGLASFLAWQEIVPGTDPSNYNISTSSLEPWSPNPLKTAVDGCGVAFNMHLFKQRGEITSLNVLCGYGELEAGLWALRHGWACVRIPTRFDHNKAGVGRNTRSALNVSAEGQHETVVMHRDALPSVVLDDRYVRLREKVIDVTWQAGAIDSDDRSAYAEALG